MPETVEIAPGGFAQARYQLAASDMAIVASGTATVQTALHDTPMVVVYRLSPLTYRVGKPFVRVDTYAMPNLVAGARIVPELIQDEATPERLADEALAWLSDEPRSAAVRRHFMEIHHRLRQDTARAASEVIERIWHG